MSNAVIAPTAGVPVTVSLPTSGAPVSVVSSSVVASSAAPTPSAPDAADAALALHGWLLAGLLILVAVVVAAMFALTFYNLSAPRSTMKNLLGIKWRLPFRDQPGPHGDEASPLAQLAGKGAASQSAMDRLVEALALSARVGTRTTRTTLAITGFSLLGVLIIAALGLSGVGIRDLRTQVAAAVTTLVATIAGFYFGSRAAVDAAPAADGGVPSTSASTFIRDPNPATATVAVGQAASYTPLLSGPAPKAVKLTSGTLPATLTVDPSNGSITGTPAVDDAGSYAIQLTAFYADNTYLTINETVVITPAVG